MNKLIVAIHFNIPADDVEGITEVVEKLQQHFQNIERVDLLNQNDYRAGVDGYRGDPYLRIWDALSETQQQIIRATQSTYGTTVGTWEEPRMREAEELVESGYLSRGQMHNRSRYYYITTKGRLLLQAARKVKA